MAGILPAVIVFLCCAYLRIHFASGRAGLIICASLCVIIGERRLFGVVRQVRDGELFERLASGDISALDELIGAYYPEILRFCLRHTPTRECAEDAAQETFLKAVRHLGAYVQRGKFRAWLYKIAANTCTDCYRKGHAGDPLPECGYTEPGFERAELAQDLDAALAALPDAQREVVLLRYVHGLKLREVSEVLDVPLRTVQSRERAALKTLRKLL